VRAVSLQVAPYAGAFGCPLGAAGPGGAGGPWQGTLFRFPLRSPDLAPHSSISKQVRCEDSPVGEV
jgi:sacsin